MANNWSVVASKEIHKNNGQNGYFDILIFSISSPVGIMQNKFRIAYKYVEHVRLGYTKGHSGENTNLEITAIEKSTRSAAYVFQWTMYFAVYDCFDPLLKFNG
jgi:hypothetical protein